MMYRLETEEETRRTHSCGNLRKNICFWRVVAAACLVLFIFGVIFILTSRPRSCSNGDQCVPAQKEQCPEGWAFYRFCFTFNSTLKSFEVAKNFCSLYNASLLEIESLSKLVWLKSKSDKKDYWIGLRNESGVFQWI
ncbi:C-type lectin domain family 2 member D-like isoform X2 [Lissotriton helveticus]